MKNNRVAYGLRARIYNTVSALNVTNSNFVKNAEEIKTGLEREQLYIAISKIICINTNAKKELLMCKSQQH